MTTHKEQTIERQQRQQRQHIKDQKASLVFSLLPLLSLLAVSPSAHALQLTSGPTATVYYTSATVTWTTDVPSDAILVSTTDSVISTVLDATVSQVHTLTVRDLVPGTVYTFIPSATHGQLGHPLFDGLPETTQKTLTPDPAQPYDFEFAVFGSLRVTAGSHTILSYRTTPISGSPTYHINIMRQLPAGIHWERLGPISDMVCSPHPDGSETCQLSGDVNGLFLISVDASVAPGSYPIPMTMFEGSVTHNYTYTLQVDPVPAPLSRIPIPTVPPIDPQALSLWENTMTGVIAKDLCQLPQTFWTGYVPYNSGSNVWFYDGARVYFQIADYTGDKSWQTCASSVAAFYRDGMVIPSNGGTYGYFAFTRGLKLDYEATGNPSSLSAIHMLVDHNVFIAGYQGLFAPLDPVFMREAAFAGINAVDAHALNFPGMGTDYFGTPGAPPHWQTNLDVLLSQFNQAMDNGPWGSVYIEPVFVGSAFDTLTAYYQYTQDPRILVTVKKMADWLWANAWDPGTKSFVYDVFSRPAVADQNLNPLIVSGYAWVWAMTGEDKYRQEADDIFYGGTVLGSTEIGEGKQFSQSYRSSFDYVKWRTHPDSVFDGPPPPPPPGVLVANASAFHPVVYPNPWRQDRHSGAITFAQITLGTSVKIYTLSGHLVQELTSSGSDVKWDRTNNKGDKVASGIYVYVITDAQGNKAKGKLAIIK